MPILLLIGLAFAAIAGPIATFLGMRSLIPTNDTSTVGGLSVLSDHPAAVAQTAAGTATAPVVVQQKPPTTKAIVSDAINSPWSIWGLGALALFSVPLIAQLRAGAHEAYSTGQDIYKGAAEATDRINNADNYTGNKSRRYRK